jgi:predicted peroxiredoxin
MRQRLAILLWATDAAQAHLCGTPFFHAAAAGAMDTEVEIYFTSKSVRLLERGIAERLYPGPARDRTVAEYMAHALEHGAKFYACSQAMAAHGVSTEMLIEGVAGQAGAAAWVGRCMDEDWVTLVY